MSQDSTHTIQRSAIRFFSGTMLSRATGFLRDMAMAFAFGTESTIAIFMAAFRFAHIFRRLLGEGSLQNTFIPYFEEFRAENPAKAQSFFRDLSASLAIILLGLIGLGILILVFLLSFFTFNPTTTLLLTLTAWMLPSLFFICLFGLNAGLLECEKSYFIPSFAPVAFNLVWMGAALLLAPFAPITAVVGMSIAVIIACAAQWFVTLPQTVSMYQGKVVPFSADVRRLIKPLFLANVGVMASQVNNALDPLFALFADSQGPAWLWFAIRVQQLPLALFGIALSGALLPPLSRAIKQGNLDQFRHFFTFATHRIALITLPIMAGIIATAPTCINLLFGRGQFDLQSVQGTALCLIAYGIGLFPMAYVLIAAPTLYALGEFKIVMRASIFAMILNIALNTLCIFILGLHTASLALSTSLAAVVNAIYLHYTLKRKADVKFDLHISKIALLSLLALLSMWAFDAYWLGSVPTLQILQGKPLALSQDLWQQLTIFGGEASIFLSVIGLGWLIIIETQRHKDTKG